MRPGRCQLRRPRLRLAAAAVACSAALGLSGCGISLQSLPKYSSLPGPFYEVHATFANVLNLPALAEVRVGVATVGQVSSIGAHDFAARVTLQIDRNVRVPVGTVAQVQFSDPLGDEYVELIEPKRVTAGYLSNGAVLTEASTSTAPSVPDTLAVLSTVLNGGGINQLHTIVDQLNLALNGHQAQIRDLFTRLDQAFGSLSAHKAQVDAALAAIGNLAAQLNAGAPTIVAGIDAIGPAVHVLAGENLQLRQLLTSVNRLAVVADHILSVTGAQQVQDVHALLPVVDQLVAVGQQVAPTLSAMARFEALTPKVAPGGSLQASLVATAVFGGAPSAGVAGAAAAISPGQVSGGPAVTALLDGALP